MSLSEIVFSIIILVIVDVDSSDDFQGFPDLSAILSIYFLLNFLK